MAKNDKVINFRKFEKTINNIEKAKLKSKNSVIIEKPSARQTKKFLKRL